MNPIRKVLASADRFTAGLLIAILCAVLIPCRGWGETLFRHLGDMAVMLLFFLYGAKLSRRAVVEGMLHWKLQGLVACSTFILFPLVGFLILLFAKPFLTSELSIGILYVCFLPSTVQSSIAFTSIAGGNVAAAVCSASVSSLLGVFLTPLFVGLFLNVGGTGLSWVSFMDICLVILFPFVAGQVAQKWIGNWVRQHKNITGWTDQSTIWIIIYTAFSHAVVQGVWGNISGESLGSVLVVCAILLLTIISLTSWLSKIFGFNREDRISIIFCGSKKSMATGIPMMNVLFAGSPLGIIVIPLMVFHQMQLMVCAVLARRWKKS